MKRFNFKFEKLLMIREYIEMEAKLKYASELQKRINIENENRVMQKSIIENILNDYLSSKEGDLIDYNNLFFQEEYINNLTYKIKKNKDLKQEIEIKLKKLREDLLIATKEKKIIAELKNKEYKKYQKVVKKEEIKQLDEVAGQMMVRKKASFAF
ncbi:MAG: flagellar FliJ family protein [Spirochaetes bacterium]|nr:flagellar FliJ family protein [Spirochaetota bacterium]